MGRLPLLEQSYGRVVVPRAVVDELDTGRAEGYDVPDPPGIEWMDVESAAIPAVLRLVTAFGPGEAEALTLALAQPTDLLIVDDALDRALAVAQGLRFTGTLGVLLQAKERHLVEALTPILDALAEAGFRMDDELRTRSRTLSRRAAVTGVVGQLRSDAADRRRADPRGGRPSRTRPSAKHCSMRPGASWRRGRSRRLRNEPHRPSSPRPRLVLVGKRIRPRRGCTCYAE